MNTNGIHSNGNNGAHTNGAGTEGLKIIVIGAGIGGLSAAIALRQQGHHVTIFESSRFATELGAAIHIPPNAHGLLKRMGIQPSLTGANPCAKMNTYAPNGRLVHSVDVAAAGKIWQHEWLLGHRVKVHNALKEAAVKLGAQLKLSSPVADVDPQSGTIFLSDGSTEQANVVVGADGVHSVTRTKVVPDHPKPFSSGKSAFRFLVPRQALLDDLETQAYAEQTGELLMAIGEDRRLVMYPTSDDTLMNFVCIHPESETSSISSGDWSNTASKDMLLSVYKDFHPDFVAILRKADEESLKVWRLMDMEVLPSWTKGRLALLGDAAHPFLPHQGQGAAVAMEDAAALATVLDSDVLADDVFERLQLYQQIRKSRADTLQEYTRIAGKDLKDSKGVGPAVMQKFLAFNFGHDEFDNSAQRLREWKWARQPPSYRRMPTAFGPMPGPRQDHAGNPRNGTKSTFTTASIKIKTSRTVLQNLFPPSSKTNAWRFKSPGTITYCSFSQTTLHGMEWLGGSGYNHLGLYIHGVEYTNPETSATTSGVYMPVLFEDLADPIVSGRDELGMPKLYSAIDVDRTTSSYKITASWRGTTWGRFELQDLREDSANGDSTSEQGSSDNTDEGLLLQRYIPMVGKEHKGQAEAEYVVFDPFNTATPKPNPQKTFSSNSASVVLDAGTWKTLPTIHHITARLAEIPVYEVVAAKVVEGTGVPDISGARRV